MTKISYIIPTIGRPNLRDTLLKMQSALGPDDEVIVVADGNIKWVADTVEDLDTRFNYHFITSPLSSYGNAQRDFGMRKSMGDWLMFFDDDDEFTLKSLDAVRAELEGKTKPVVFAMEYMGKVLEKSLAVGEVGTPQLATPLPKKTRWMQFVSSGALSDNAFINGVVEEFSGCTFSDIIVCTVKQHGRGVWF